MIKVAIIVLHFGDREKTYHCLRSVAKIHREYAYTVFVVDNGTNSIQDSIVKKMNPNSRVIHNKENLGFSAGNNVAIKLALEEKYSHILLLNNDTTIDPQLLTYLLPLFKNPHVGIVGPVITYMQKPHIIWFAGGYVNRFFCFTKHRGMNKNIRFLPSQDKTISCDFITGAAMLIKREVFETIGLLPENYFLYWEDVDFSFKAHTNGYESMLLCKPLVRHSVSATTGTIGKNSLSPLRAYYFARNPFIFLEKQFPHKIGGLIGQFLAFPYYFLQVENMLAAKNYIRGFNRGLQIFFSTPNLRSA